MDATNTPSLQAQQPTSNAIASAIGQAVGTAASTAEAPVTDVVTAAIRLGLSLIDRVWPDPAQKSQAQLALLQLAQNGDLSKLQMQTDVNKVEAASPSIFVAGWRPFIGWTCGVGLAVQYVIRPLAEGLGSALHHPFTFPTLDVASLLTLMGGMLGLSGLRSYDKNAGIDTKNFQ